MEAHRISSVPCARVMVRLLGQNPGRRSRGDPPLVVPRHLGMEHASAFWSSGLNPSVVKWQMCTLGKRPVTELLNGEQKWRELLCLQKRHFWDFAPHISRYVIPVS